jgi:hypothetical protein
VILYVPPTTLADHPVIRPSPKSTLAGLAALESTNRAPTLSGAVPTGMRDLPCELGALHRAVLRHLPSWWRADEHQPAADASCSCCFGVHWWTRDGRGWCCWTCHPPDHLPATAVMEVTT